MGDPPEERESLMSKLVELNGMLRMSETRLRAAKTLRVQLEEELRIEQVVEGVLTELAKRGEAKLEQLVVSGLAAVYGPSYKFKRSGKNLLVDNGVVEVEISERGGGITDVVSLLLRVLAMVQGKGGSIRTLILDEPLKSVDAETARKMSKFLRLLTDRLGVNVLMVTHRMELTEAATEIYEVTQEAGSTKLTFVGE